MCVLTFVHLIILALFVCLFLAAGSEREQHITVPGRVQRGRGDWFRELRNRLQVHQQTRSVWDAVR